MSRIWLFVIGISLSCLAWTSNAVDSLLVNLKKKLNSTDPEEDVYLHGWAAAKKIWTYETPLIDLELVSDPTIVQRFSKLQRNVLNFDGEELLKKMWTGEKGGRLGLERPFTNCAAKDKVPLNSMYGTGDGCTLYSMIVTFKPRKIIEIGAGFSSMYAANAIRHLSQRENNDAQYTEHVIVEPYRVGVIKKGKKAGHFPKNHQVRIIAEKIQHVNYDEFTALKANDILFLDTSHVLQPYGDTIFEFLWLLPILQSGVVVHVHDIFLPYDYPQEWMKMGRRQFTEQYMLAAFLHGNSEWEILWPTHYMNKHYGAQMYKDVKTSRSQICLECAGSFWFRKR